MKQLVFECIKSYAQLTFNSRCKDITDFIKKHTRVVIMTIRDQVTGDYIATGVGIEVR